MELGQKYLREEKLSQARDAFTKCISVTHLMAMEVIAVSIYVLLSAGMESLYHCALTTD